MSSLDQPFKQSITNSDSMVKKEIDNPVINKKDVNVKVYDANNKLLFESRYNPDDLASTVRADINSKAGLTKNRNLLMCKAISYRKDTPISIMCEVPKPPCLRYLSTSTSTATIKESELKIADKFGDYYYDTYFGLEPLNHIKITIEKD